MPAATAASDLRLAIRGLTHLASSDLGRLWREVADADRAQDRLRNILPPLTSTYRLAAATVAADWYDGLRDVSNQRRRFTAVVPDVEGDVGVDALAGWAVGPLYSSQPDWAAAMVRVVGGLQLRIANAARETVTTSAVTDPSARGWRRDASGGCSFCEMLAERGAVYSEESADFETHEHCQCVAVPVF